ncbi:MAG: gliding motility-associated C-terminal domain-containing protein, partial [Flavobacteriales bacterium]
EVYVQKISKKEANKTAKVFSKEINVKPSPSAEFEFNLPKDEYRKYVELRNESSFSNSIEWKIDNELIKNKNELTHYFKRKGTHKIAMIARNEYGCKTSNSKKISLDHTYNLKAPNAITRNGNGRNDAFMPRTLTELNLEFEMLIYDRNSGNLIFRTKDPGNPWKGRLKDGSKAAAGKIYPYKIKLRKKNGETEVYKGGVYLSD